jgi:hypothetical protein
MAVEARFVCTGQQVVDQASSQVRLMASTDGRDNTEWAPYTPAGTIDLVINGPAGHEFVQGGRYAVTIRRLPDDEPPQTT